ncbi:hypothetical protein KEF29_16775 [Streptomyces tuirus]|uniref:Uncharacterized protein n=1 Tax=Streptomyces tuirus TaxID=68278 RepID=A0A941FC70_9ACTN|nr:hypothetical protein [Streptomyces tuirus]
MHAEITRLRQLGSDFDDLHGEIRSLALTPGTEARPQLTSTITAAKKLVHRATECLAVLDGSQYTAAPGCRPALEALASVYSATVASSEESQWLSQAAFTSCDSNSSLIPPRLP